MKYKNYISQCYVLLEPADATCTRTAQTTTLM